LLLVDDRAQLDVSGRVADGQIQRVFDERLGVLADDGLVHEMPPGGQADLALMEEGTPGTRARRSIDVHAGKHDIRVVAAQFQGHTFDHLAGAGTDLATSSR
jgi:hypothetical protein